MSPPRSVGPQQQRWHAGGRRAGDGWNGEVDAELIGRPGVRRRLQSDELAELKRTRSTRLSSMRRPASSQSNSPANATMYHGCINSGAPGCGGLFGHCRSVRVSPQLYRYSSANSSTDRHAPISPISRFGSRRPGVRISPPRPRPDCAGTPGAALRADGSGFGLVFATE